MIEYLSLFSGIGAFEKALTNLHIPFELVGYSEIDKYASKAYSLIHKVPESMNLGDITKIDESILPQVDLITYGFPCQDISLALMIRPQQGQIYLRELCEDVFFVFIFAAESR